MSNINVETQRRNTANYRFGVSFDYAKVKFAWRRQPYANKLVVGVIDDAIGKKFDIIDVGTGESIENNKEAMEVIETMWLDIIKNIHFQRAYGKSLGMLFKVDGREMPVWRAYDTNDYFVEYDDFGFPIKYTITNRIGGTAAKVDMRDVVANELDFTYELIINETEAKGDGISVLESVWDQLFALSQLDENGTYYAIRYGAGIRYLKIPQSKLTDSTYMNSLLSFLEGSVGVNGVHSLPYTEVPGGTRMETEIVNESAVQIRFLELRDMLLGSLSSQTGIPREVFLGSQIGLRSSEKNEDSYFDYLQSIQDDYKPFFKWIIHLLNGIFEWFGEDTIIDIKYVGRDTLSDDETVEMIKQKVEIANKAGFDVDKEWLANILDIPLEDKVIPPQLDGFQDGTDDADDADDAEVVEEEEEKTDAEE